MKKTWVKILAACAVLLALGAGLYLQLNSYSETYLEKYKRELRAAGEKLDLAELVPPPVAPESNGLEAFCMATNLFHSKVRKTMLARNPPDTMLVAVPGKAVIRWQQPDVRGCFYYYPFFYYYTNTWAELDAALDANSDVLELLHSLPRHPELQFQVDYGDPGRPLSHLAELKFATLFLSSAAISDLHKGNSMAAATNVHVMLSIINAWNEPIEISQYVRIAVAHMASCAQWELLQSTNVSDEELALLQRDWERLEFMHSMENALQVERLYVAAKIKEAWTTTNEDIRVGFNTNRSPRVVGSGASQPERGAEARKALNNPVASIDEFLFLRGDQVWIDAVRRFKTNGVLTGVVAEKDRKLRDAGVERIKDNWFLQKVNQRLGIGLISVAFLDLHGIELKRLAEVEGARRITLAAIGLKRYQLRHGHYPGDLTQLVPEILPELPKDPVDGKPLRYAMNSDGTFLLYSIGLDEVDDGGNPFSAANPRSHHWLRGRDWVWPQPATAPEIQQYYDSW